MYSSDKGISLYHLEKFIDIEILQQGQKCLE